MATSGNYDTSGLMELMAQISGKEIPSSDTGQFSRYKSIESYNPEEQLANLRALNQRQEDQQARDSLARMRNSLLGAKYSGDARGMAEAQMAIDKIETEVSGEEDRRYRDRDLQMRERENQADRASLETRSQADLDLRKLLGQLTNTTQNRQIDSSEKIGMGQNAIAGRDVDVKELLGRLGLDMEGRKIDSNSQIQNRQIDSSNSMGDRELQLKRDIAYMQNATEGEKNTKEYDLARRRIAMATNAQIGGLTKDNYSDLGVIDQGKSAFSQWLSRLLLGE